MGHPVLLSNSLHLDQLSNRPAWIFFCGPTLLVAFAELCGHVLAVHAVVAKLAAFAVNQSKGYRLKLDFNYAQSKRYRLKIDFNYAQSKGYRLKLEFNRKWNQNRNNLNVSLDALSGASRAITDNVQGGPSPPGHGLG